MTRSPRRTRRIVEYGGWADMASWKGPGTPVLGNGSLVLRRRKERSIHGRRKLSYVGIDVRATPSRDTIRTSKGRRATIEWRNGSYTTPTRVRPGSVDEVHFHMINDSSLNPTTLHEAMQNIHRMLRTNGRVYVTLDNKMIGDTTKSRGQYLNELLHQFYASRLFRTRFLSMAPEHIPPEMDPLLPRTPGKKHRLHGFENYWFKVRGHRAFRSPAKTAAKLTQFKDNTEVFAILTKRAPRAVIK